MRAAISSGDVTLKGDTVMFNAEKYIREFEKAQGASEEIRSLKKAIAAAGAEKEAEWQFIFMQKCIKKSVFESDAIDALIIFPQMVELFDNNPEIQDEHMHDLMWSYKYILENLSDFHNITLDQGEKLFNDFKNRCQTYGYSQRALKYLREKMSVNTGNFLSADKYGSFIDEPVDDLKDCEACECSFNVISSLAVGDKQKALKISRPITDGDLYCQEVPQLTYNAFIEYALINGDYPQAICYARKLYPMISGNVDMLNAVGTLLCLYSQTSLYNGIRIFRRELRSFISCKNPMLRFSFANGAYRIFKKYTESSDEKFKKINIRLAADFELYNSNNEYTTEELRAYFYNIASDLAEKFDNRNKNTFISDKLSAQYPEYSEEKCKDIVHCYTEYVPSAIAAVCKTPGDKISFDKIKERISEMFLIDDASINEESNLLQLRISNDDEQYDVFIGYEDLIDPSSFRPVHYINPSVFDKSENMLLSLVMFNDKADKSLQFQLKLLNAIHPDAAAYLDLSRHLALSTQWVALQCKSSAPPLVSYLYNLNLISQPDSEKVFISTEGLNCCGIKDIVVPDATKENYSSYCDMICFIAEGAILWGSLKDSKEICSTLRSNNNKTLSITWLPFSESKEYYSSEFRLFSQIIDSDELSDTMVLFKHNGEDESGQSVIERLSEVSDKELSEINYGVYIDSEKKNRVYSAERYDIFCRLVSEYPDNGYACMALSEENGDDSVWIKVTECDEKNIKGIITYKCSLGEIGDSVILPASDMINFNFSLEENSLEPDSAYIADLY